MRLRSVVEGFSVEALATDDGVVLRYDCDRCQAFFAVPLHASPDAVEAIAPRPIPEALTLHRAGHD